MAGDDVVSAIPGVLMSYSTWAQGLDGSLQKQAHALYTAIDAGIVLPANLNFGAHSITFFLTHSS